MMAGVALLALGFLRLGTYIKYIPHPVIVGFTAGIAVIILASQLRDLFGLDACRQGAGRLPAEARRRLWSGRRTFNPAAARDRRGHDRDHRRACAAIARPGPAS